MFAGVLGTITLLGALQLVLSDDLDALLVHVVPFFLTLGEAVHDGLGRRSDVAVERGVGLPDVDLAGASSRREERGSAALLGSVTALGSVAFGWGVGGAFGAFGAIGAIGVREISFCNFSA